MRKACTTFFLTFWGLFLFTGISLYSQSKGIRIVTKEGKIIPLYEKSCALVIGVSKYTKGWQNLESIPREIDEVETALKKHGFEVKKVLNPTYDQLKQAFDNFINEYGFNPNNRLLFFFSGHGYTRKRGKKGYIVPSDAPNPVHNERGFVQKSVEMEQIITWARRIEAKHALFLFDSCFSGMIFKAKDTPVPRHISYLTANDVRQFISAGSAREQLPAKSVFTPAFVRGINGEADLDKDGYVTGTELGVYLQEKVLSYKKGQTPQYGKLRDPDYDEGDFVFVAKKIFEPPTEPPTIDFRDLENEAKWAEWQTNFQNKVNELNKYDKNYGISADSKVRAWENILEAYHRNNPYSHRDDQLRDYAKERIRYWKGMAEEKSGDLALSAYPLDDKPAVIKSVDSIANEINEKDKENLGNKLPFTITQSRETRTIAGVRMPVAIQVEGIKLVLNGMALRKKFIFKVSAVGLYLLQKDSEPENILNAVQPRQIVQQYLRSISAVKLAESLPADASPALKKDFDSLNNCMENVKEGDVVVYTYLPEKGTEIKVKGKIKGRIIGKDFADALFARYIGPTSIYGVSNALLGK